MMSPSGSLDNLTNHTDHGYTMTGMDKSTKTPSLDAPISPASEPERQDEEFNYLSGWRFYVVAAALQLALFLVNFEITIVSTALVSISNDLNDFGRTSWVVTAYLITYTAGLVIVAKLSDIFGRKKTYLTVLLIFIAFSGGCGGAQTMVQLIVLRALQGAGGGGLYAVAFVMLFELVPKARYPVLLVFSVALAVLGNALGPVIGGVISQRTTWRWVFLINVPVGTLIAFCVLISVPNDYPYQGFGKERATNSRLRLSNIDFTGAILMLTGLALVISGLEDAASLLSWTSASTLAPIIVSAFVWVAFLFSQWWFTKPGSSVQPVFPWRFCQSRLVMGLILNSFFTGTVSIALIIQLPIRYQTTLGVSPLEAGVRLLPFVLLTSVGAAVSGAIVKNRRVAPIYVGLFGIILQIIGLVFLSAVPPDHPDWQAVYGLQVLVGFGAGCNIGIVTLLTPYVVEHRDLAVATAAGTQFRFLGSAVVVSITTAVGNSWVRDRLSGTLTSKQIQDIFRSSATISDLSPELEAVVRKVFVQSFNLQFHIILGFAVASAFSILLMWKRKQILVD
ncbi:drug resistance transporter [Xylariaceae sp. FL0594]|nr:drug resistance transporter [Xylariaceae sp. FL0594]